MRISDWSSDVCSSDLILSRRHNDYEAIVKTVGKLCRAELVEEFEIGINYANGFLDAEGVLHDHSPKYGKTFTMPFNYVPERAGEAHKWLRYLEDAWGDEIGRASCRERVGQYV